jgi:hypothetical protein
MTREELDALMLLAGFKPKGVWETTNKYWGKNDVTGPWWLVQVDQGMIQIGWRKRVISIDWSNTGRALEVTKDDVTKESYLVHAWNNAKAVEYLTALRRGLETEPASESDNK